MNERGLFIAAILDSGAGAHAAGAVARLQDMDHEAQELLSQYGFQPLVSDVRSRIGNLSEALAVGRPEILRADVDWLAATYVARNIPLKLLHATLRGLREELAENLPAESDPLVSTYIDDSLAGLNGTVAVPGSRIPDGAPHAQLARRFLLAMLEGKRDEALRMIVEAFEQGTSLSELHVDVISAVQSEVGRMWQTGEVHIGEEHMGSRIVEEALVLLRERISPAPANGRTVVTASVPGNLHDIGARMVSDHFEMAGWSSVFLGADTPAEALVRTVADFDADLVALSTGLGTNLRSTASIIAALRGASAVPVIVGGRPFRVVPDLWRDVGADAQALDPAEAVREGERLVAGS